MSNWYAVQPSDTLLIRDGRDFVTGDGAKYESTLPNPSTMGGAMGAAIGGRFDFLRGPYLAKHLSGDEWLPYFPLPMNVLSSGKERQRVSPSPTPLDGTATSLIVGERLTLQPEGNESWEYNHALISVDILNEFLQDAAFVPSREEEETLESLVPVEHRIGIARENGQTIDGFLYQAQHRRPHEAGVAFVVETDQERESIKNRAVPFGGAGRKATIEQVDDAEVPEALSEYPGGRVLLYVATPGVWRSGSTPPLPQNVAIVAANIGAAEPIAIGGSHRNGINSTAFFWTVPAGSVYFLQFNSEEEARVWAEEHHGVALAAGDSDKEKEMASTGFGVVFTGKWSPANDD